MQRTPTIVVFNIQGLLKQSRPTKRDLPITYHAFPHDVALCTVATLEFYLSARGKLVNAALHDELFRCYRNPHGPATRDTLARWVKMVLGSSGVNLDTFSAHSCRSASTSKAAASGVSLERILMAGQWSTSSTFYELNGKMFYPFKKRKYLGVYLETLSGESHSEELIRKLNRANGMLAKIRHFVHFKVLKNIYHAIFSSHLMYGCQVLVQNLCSVTEKMSILQKNAVRIINFSDFKAHSEPLFKKLDILKFKDNIILQNCLFVYDYLKGNLPNSFIDAFRIVDETYPNITQSAVTGQLTIPTHKTTRYGLKSIYKRCIDSWNMISEISLTKSDPKTDLSKIHSRKVLKTTITKRFLSSYN